MLGAAELAAAAGARLPAPAPVSEETLEKVAGSLEMYVDALPTATPWTSTAAPRFFNLSLATANGGGLAFHVIGSEASYLPRPAAVSHLLIGVSESFDLVVDFSDCHADAAAAGVELVNTAPYPFPDGDAPDDLNGKVMKFIVDAPAPEKKKKTEEDSSRLPARLPEYAAKVETSAAAKRWYIVLYEYDDSETGNPTHLYIKRAAAGGTEVTTIVVNFFMVDSGEPYPFDATAEPGYVYQCHILDHEDNAMIRPLKLIK